MKIFQISWKILTLSVSHLRDCLARHLLGDIFLYGRCYICLSLGSLQFCCLINLLNGVGFHCPVLC